MTRANKKRLADEETETAVKTAEAPQNNGLENNLPKNIFALANRGMLLDIFVFLLNLLLMRWLTARFLDIVRQASGGDAVAGLTLLTFCIAIFVLPPLGATLKRRHFHQRLSFRGNEGKKSTEPDDFAMGCLFNPIFFFCLNIVIYAGINAFVMQRIYGDREAPGGVFISSIFFGIVLVTFQTFIVYRYFSKPKKLSASEFLRSPQSETLGDVCIFLNMILFQVVWNIITMTPFPRVSGVGEFAGRLFLLIFVALLVYFPPRIFYLAEDIKRRRVWLTILLANAPVIFRVLIGTNSNW